MPQTSLHDGGGTNRRASQPSGDRVQRHKEIANARAPLAGQTAGKAFGTLVQILDHVKQLQGPHAGQVAPSSQIGDLAVVDASHHHHVDLHGHPGCDHGLQRIQNKSVVVPAGNLPMKPCVQRIQGHVEPRHPSGSQHRRSTADLGVARDDLNLREASLATQPRHRLAKRRIQRGIPAGQLDARDPTTANHARHPYKIVNAQLGIRHCGHTLTRRPTKEARPAAPGVHRDTELWQSAANTLTFHIHEHETGAKRSASHQEPIDVRVTADPTSNPVTAKLGLRPPATYAVPMISGVLIAESVRAGATLDKLHLAVTSITRWRNDHPAEGQPDVWTIIAFKSADEPRELATQLSQVLDEPGWYVDFHDHDTTYVVFPKDHIFSYPRGDAAGRAEAIAYGQTVGVPDDQLDWNE
jgi:hypothetical protein